jgi:hypothetical protein
MGRSMLSLSIYRRFPLQRRFNKVRSLQQLLASQEGLRCDSAELVLEIVTEIGDTRKLRFFCDTGADHLVIPVYVARREGIRYREDFPGTLGSSVGGSARCYFDFVQVRSSLSGRTHRWVCAFAESVQSRLLVGRAGFLNDFAAGVNSGELVVSHAVSLGRFLKHHLARLRSRPRSDDDWEPI